MPPALRASSIGSPRSVGSIGSLLSVGSIGSLLSVGSIGSLLSVGSIGSVASIGSVGQVGAVGGTPVLRSAVRTVTSRIRASRGGTSARTGPTQTGTALVTGASSGIGEVVARRLAAAGMDVVLVARRVDRLDALAADLRSAHPAVTVHVLAADLSDPGAPDALVTELATLGLVIDLLVNNAGVGVHGRFAEESTARVVDAVGLNCGALVALTSRLLPAMLARGHGGVLNVASTSAYQPVPTLAVYAATKAFVLSFTEAIWAENRDSGVRVMALCPGATQTEFYDAAGGGAFLTRGRRSAEAVVDAGLHAFWTGRAPSYVPGLNEKVLSKAYRFFPRTLIVRMAEIRLGNR